MKNVIEENTQERQVCSIPPVLIKELGGSKLSLFRVKTDGKDFYQLEYNENALFLFNSWQYHILNALFSFGGDSYDTLLVNANDMFGLNLRQNDLDLLFDKIGQKRLFDKENAPKHPLTKDFLSGANRNIVDIPATDSISATSKESGKSLPSNRIKQSASKFAKDISNPKLVKSSAKSFSDKALVHLKDIFKVHEKWSDEPKNDNTAQTASEESDSGYGIKDIDLFNPTNFLKKYKDVLLTGKYLLYPLPLFLFASIFVLGRNPEIVNKDLIGLFDNFSIFGHVFFGMFTVSAFVTFVTAAVAYSFGATVTSISVKCFFGFIPRFIPKMIDTEKFNRNQKLWLHASPLLARLGIFSLGVFLWYNTRHFDGLITHFGAVLAFTSIISFFISSCPFYRSNGYGFLAEFFNEPHLWGKSVNALMNKLNKEVYTNSDNRVLISYAMICILFIVALVLGVFTVVNNWLGEELGSKSYFVIAVLFGVYVTKLAKQLKEVNDTYQSNLQFERWRDRTFVTEPEAESAVKKEPNYKKRLLVATGLILLLFPYSYEPSGQITVLPTAQEQISTDIAGIIDEVNFEGGEFVKKGEVIAKLSVSDNVAKLNVLNAKLREKQAYVDQLKAMPTAEQVMVAQERLETARVASEYSEAECERQRPLFDSGSISLSEISEIEKGCVLDLQRVLEAEAELDKVMAGVSAEEIAVAEASLKPIESEIQMYKDKIERSELRMPFDGKLATLHLKEKRGHFLERGESFAIAQDDSGFKAVLQVPESDVAYIKQGADVNIRTQAYPEDTFKGKVAAIETDVELQNNQRMVRMIVRLNDEQNKLKSGLSGFAKVQGDTLMVWEVLTQSIVRFVTVEMWAWIP